MNCCQCKGIEELFNEKSVSHELSNYRAKGPDQTTRMLIDALKKAGVLGLTLLDIGGGVGAIQHELLEAGALNATDVDASQAYLKAAQEEAQRRGIVEKITFVHGNFAEEAAKISPADVVTLDRVICCYPDMQKMVSLSVSRACKLYGLVYPRDSWWLTIGFAIANIFFRIQRNPFRIFQHPTESVEALVTEGGFKRLFYGKTWMWQVVVYSHEGV